MSPNVVRAGERTCRHEQKQWAVEFWHLFRSINHCSLSEAPGSVQAHSFLVFHVLDIGSLSFGVCTVCGALLPSSHRDAELPAKGAQYAGAGGVLAVVDVRAGHRSAKVALDRRRNRVEDTLFQCGWG